MTNLQRIRKERGLTQKQLAELSGVNLRMVQKYESGEKNINHAQFLTVRMLALTLNCEFVDDLLEMDDEAYLWLIDIDKKTEARNKAQNGTK